MKQERAHSLAVKVFHARSWWQRARGLIGHPPPLPGAGMLFDETSAVHGFGMAHALDIVFLDAGRQVLDCGRLPRFGICWKPGARAVLEMREGEVARLGIRPGMRLHLQNERDIF